MSTTSLPVMTPQNAAILHVLQVLRDDVQAEVSRWRMVDALISGLEQRAERLETMALLARPNRGGS